MPSVTLKISLLMLREDNCLKPMKNLLNILVDILRDPQLPSTELLNLKMIKLHSWYTDLKTKQKLHITLPVL